MSLKLVIAILILFVFPTFHIYSQCDGLQADRDSGYPYKSWDNRCEGFYEAEVGAPSIEVVGFYKGKFDYKRVENEVITVVAMVDDFHEWNIQAVGIPLDYYYRMDAQFNDSGAFTWPAKDVIFPKKIMNTSIGIYAWKEVNGQRYFSPVEIQSKYLNNLADQKYRLLIRAATAVNEVYWRYNTPSWSRIQQNFAAGEAIIIELAQPIQKEFHLELNLKERSSGRFIPKKIYLAL